MTVAYLMFRVSDYLEDNTVMDRDRKVRLLNLWDSVLAEQEPEERLAAELRKNNDGDPEAEVARRFRTVIRALEGLGQEHNRIVRLRVRQTTQGMARRQLLGPVIRTEAELDEYMHHVAGVVGYLICDIFSMFHDRLARRRDRLLGLAHEYGLGLQTVNVIRGIRKDFSRGWSYVPLEYLEDVGLDPRGLLSPRHIERSLGVVRRLADKAERHLRSGLGYVLEIPRTFHRLRLATMWPLLFAARTLAVSRENPEVILSEAKMSREDVETIVRKTTLMGWSNRWLTDFHEQLLRGKEGAQRRNSR
jgi:farnesyl-diphosphate farnesyltransferase